MRLFIEVVVLWFLLQIRILNYISLRIGVIDVESSDDGDHRRLNNFATRSFYIRFPIILVTLTAELIVFTYNQAVILVTFLLVLPVV